MERKKVVSLDEQRQEKVEDLERTVQELRERALARLEGTAVINARPVEFLMQKLIKLLRFIRWSTRFSNQDQQK